MTTVGRRTQDSHSGTDRQDSARGLRAWRGNREGPVHRRVSVRALGPACSTSFIVSLDVAAECVANGAALRPLGRGPRRSTVWQTFVDAEPLLLEGDSTSVIPSTGLGGRRTLLLQVTVVSNVADVLASGQWRWKAFSRKLRSVISASPYDAITHSVLTVYADRPGVGESTSFLSRLVGRIDGDLPSEGAIPL